MSESFDEIKSLIKKADERADDPISALQFSQAALNAANALRVLVDIRRAESEM